LADEMEDALEWARFGENDWSVTLPSRAVAVYAGPRFALFDPGPSAGLNQRLSLNVDLRFDHRLSLNRQGKAKGVVSREGGLDRLFRRIGYAAELQTGDAAFDARAWLGLDDRKAARALGERADLRALILELFDAGVTRIEVGAKGVKARLAYVPSPAMDGGRALSGAATRLDTLIRRWPKGPAKDGLGHRLARFERGAWGQAWAGLCILAVLWAALFSEEADARQIETFAHVDWTGLAVLFGVIVAPAALLFARLAVARRLLTGVVLAALAVLPFSYRLRVVEANRSVVREQANLVWGQVSALAEDPKSPGYLAFVTVAGRDMEWTLSREEGDLAREGRLCAAAATARGRRGMRFVTGMRTWTCRSWETGRRARLQHD
jgi:hypothetical protein